MVKKLARRYLPTYLVGGGVINPVLALIDLVMTYLQQVNSERQEKLRKALEEAALAKKIKGGLTMKNDDGCYDETRGFTMSLPWV